MAAHVPLLTLVIARHSLPEADVKPVSIVSYLIAANYFCKPVVDFSKTVHNYYLRIKHQTVILLLMKKKKKKMKNEEEQEETLWV